MEKTQVKLDKNIFEAKVNPEILSLYVRIFRSRQRQGASKVKTRREVSGGGAKPWRQKGTGRARAGSTRSPIWVHGGIVHGPKPKDWSLNITKGMKKAALRSALSLKNKSKEIIVFDGFKKDVKKTKDVLKELKGLGYKGKALFVSPKRDEALLKAARNIAGFKVTNTQSLNVYDILNAKTIIFTRESLEGLKERL